MDKFSYVAPARVKVLLVPTTASHRNFQRYCELMASSVEARLSDISPIDLKYFNPQSFPSGRLLFDYSTSQPESNSIYLHDFEPFRKTFIVIAVGSYSDASEKILADLKRLYPSTISRNVIYFDAPEDVCHKLNEPADHSLKHTFYHDSKSLTSLDAFVGDIGRNFLAALDEYAASYQNITLRSPVSITDSQLLTKRISQAQKRLSSGSSSIKISFTPSPSQPDNKNRLQTKHNGRQLKLLASFYLLAGKYLDAVSTFAEALVLLRKAEDYMWMGSSLEGLGAAVVMLNYVEVPYQLPNATLTSVLQISKSKLRDMSISDDPALRKSSESLSSASINSSTNKPALSPRNSTSSGLGFPIQLGATQDVNAIAVPELIKHIAAKVSQFYQLSANDLENTVPDLVYIESLIRSCKFMTIVCLNGPELHSNFYEALVRLNKIKPSNDLNPWFCKPDILRELDKIFHLQLVDLELQEQCTIYCALAAIFDDLEMYRKKAFMLRTLLVGLLPKLESKVKTDPEHKELIHVNSSRSSQLTGLRQVLDLLIDTYGITLEPEKSQEDALKNASSGWSSMHLSFIKLYIKLLESTNDYSTLLKVYTVVLTRFLHCLPEHVEIMVKEKIEKLMHLSFQNNLELSIPYWDPFLVRSVKLLHNHNKDELLPFDEYKPSRSRAVSINSVTPKANGVTTPQPSNAVLFDPYNKSESKSKFANDQILIKDEVYELQVTFQNPYSFELELSELSIVGDVEGSIQTIRSGIKQSVNTSVSPMLAKNGVKPPPKGLLSLQKMKTEPKLGLDKRIKSTTGLLDSPKQNTTAEYVNSNAQSSSFALAPHSLETLIIPFQPLTVGTLKIKGLNVAVGYCDPQFFAIASSELPIPYVKLKATTTSKSENPLESVSSNLKDNKIVDRVQLSEIEFSIIPPQPTLVLTDSTVKNGWLMLLEGEKFEFSVSLVNQSPEPINFLSFSFWDSTIQALTKRLETNSIGNRGLSPIDVYEIEWYLLKFKAFKIMNKDEINERYKPIKPQKDIKINYEVTGKRGLTTSKIILEYANKLSDLSQCFMKTVEIPLSFSILPSIELINCDILPLLRSSLFNFVQSSSDALDCSGNNLDLLNDTVKQLMDCNEELISDYCIMLFDLRNSCGEDLRIDIDFRVDNERNFKIEAVIKPGKTSRFLVPMKRVSTNTCDMTKPIPSLRNKQFIKNYQMSDAMESEMKEAFWLRDHILDKIRGHWRYADSSRQGDIDFRNIRLSRKMCNILVYSKVKVVHKIIKEESSKEVQRNGSQFEVNCEEFYTLKTSITNYCEHAIRGTLKHIPFPIMNAQSVVKREHFNLDKRLLINGLFETDLGSAIQPLQTKDIYLSFTILEKGEYEWGSLLDIDDEEQTKVIGREPVYLLAS